MKSTEIAHLVGCSPQFVRKQTKSACERGERYITIKGRKILYRETEGDRGGHAGRVYIYTPCDLKEPKKKKSGVGVVLPSALPQVELERPSIEDKMQIVSLYNKTRSTVGAIARAYELESASRYQAKSLERRFWRWIKKFQEGGREALEDGRGSMSQSRVDWDIFLASIVQNGHIKSYYARYCYMWSKKREVAYDVFAPKSDISYSHFVKYFNKHKSDEMVKAILRGPDALDRLEPVFKKHFDYANEMWEIDATSIDIMAKVPVIEGEVSFFETQKSDEYILKRFSLIGVVDRYSGGRVYILRKSDTSYSDVRLIEKAFGELGVPESIKGDNGKNYVSEHFQDVLERLGVCYIAANPYSGWEKGAIERGFGSLQHHHLFENLPGFVGHNPKERIDIENQNSKKSRRKSAAATNVKGQLLWWWEAEEVVDGLIAHLYGEQMKIHKNIAKDMKIENLHIQLGRRASRKLQREGITYSSHLYVNYELFYYFNIGAEVEVYEEIDDIGVLWAKIGEKRFLKMVDERSVNITVEEAKEIKRAYKKTHIKTVKDAVRDGWSSFEELRHDNVAALKELSSIGKREIKETAVVEQAEEKSQDLDDLIRLAGYGGYDEDVRYGT